jgi:hypothetical protein
VKVRDLIARLEEFKDNELEVEVELYSRSMKIKDLEATPVIGRRLIGREEDLLNITFYGEVT